MDVKWIVVAIAASTVACASTGAVPRPFPVPGAGHESDPGTTAGGRPASDPGVGTPVTRPPAGHVDGYALVGTALALRGAPYRNGGSDPSGFDCSGFTQYVFAQYGLSLPRGVRDQYQQGKSVDVRDLAPGDLVFFATTDPGVSHVAILVGADQFVHAPSSSGVVRVERLSSSYWSPRFVGARRIS